MRRAAALALLLVAACSGRSAPTPDDPTPRAPDLTGRRVMLLPAQALPGSLTSTAEEAVAGLDGELAYWLGERAPRVQWVFPPELDRALARSPSLDIQIRGLAVSAFYRGEVKNIGDPLFGDLRRLGALVDARYALVPVGAGEFETEGGRRVELRVALIDTLGGSVLWYGAIAGETGPSGDAALAASAAQALAAALVQ